MQLQRWAQICPTRRRWDTALHLLSSSIGEWIRRSLSNIQDIPCRHKYPSFLLPLNTCPKVDESGFVCIDGLSKISDCRWFPPFSTVKACLDDLQAQCRVSSRRTDAAYERYTLRQTNCNPPNHAAQTKVPATVAPCWSERVQRAQSIE
jgi:hypothetical protein